MVPEQDDGATAYLGPQHHLSLERRAAQALAAQDFHLALAYADRRCRIDPAPAAHCFVLRAEANWHLGRQTAALSDIAEALSIAPSDVNANRRMLLWSEDERCRAAAAANLIAHEETPNTVRSAIAVLQASGERRWTAVSAFDSHVAGWIAWRGGADIEATIAFDGGSSNEYFGRGPVSSIGQPSDPSDELSASSAAFRATSATDHEVRGRNLQGPAASTEPRLHTTGLAPRD